MSMATANVPLAVIPHRRHDSGSAGQGRISNAHASAMPALLDENSALRLRMALSDCAGASGFSCYMFSVALMYGHKLRRVEISNFPEEWQNRYRESRHAKSDPVVDRAKTTSLPFFWDDLRPCAAEHILDEAASYGLRHGVTTPLRGRALAFGLLSMASPTPPHPAPTHLQELQLATIQYRSSQIFQDALGAIGAIEPVNRAVTLTARESECLRLSSEGFKSKQIAGRLGIAISTVSFHIDNGIRKLGARSRTAAVATAIEAGIWAGEDEMEVASP